MSSAPEIPQRRSSKRAASTEPKPLKDVKLQKVQEEIERAESKVRPQASFNSDHWVKRSIIVEKKLSKNQLNRQISLEQFKEDTGSSEAVYLSTDQAKLFTEEHNALSVQLRLFKKQSQELTPTTEDMDKVSRRSFVQTFTTSKLGLGIATSGAGGRDGREQSKFRRDLINQSQQRQDLSGIEFKCPITKKWLAPTSMNAAHLYPVASGQLNMLAIFGREAENEMMSACNGMFISRRAEPLLEDGLLCIVPDVADNPTPAEISAWTNSEPKNYKIKIAADPNDPRILTKLVDEGTDRFIHLHNSKVEFGSNDRPRARYLYWVYLIGVLKQSWKAKIPARAPTEPNEPPSPLNPPTYSNPLENELGKPYWGTPGPWLKKPMLRAFIEELGHDYQGLMGDVESPSRKSRNEQEVKMEDDYDPRAILAATEHIAQTASQKLKSEQEEDMDVDEAVEEVEE
ncbi:MAG: hypothetical protein Q9204_005100 [Flavoplaca sp. TL-2023a]